MTANRTGRKMEDTVAEMRARLEAQPRNDELVAAIKKRRHDSAVAVGLRCPKHLGCEICDAARRAK